MTRVTKWDNLARWIRGSSSVKVNEDGDGGVTLTSTASGGGGGSGTRSRGTYAARPASPSEGDEYYVTDLPETVLRCWTAGTWVTYWRGVEVTPVNSGWTQRNFSGTAALNALGPYTEFVGNTVGGNAVALALRTRTVPSPWYVEVGLSLPWEFGVAAEVETGGYWIAQPWQTGGGFVFQGYSAAFAFSSNIGSVSTEFHNNFYRFESVSSALVRILASQDRVTWRVVLEQSANANLLDAAPTIGVSVRNNSAIDRRCVITHFAHAAL